MTDWRYFEYGSQMWGDTYDGVSYIDKRFTETIDVNLPPGNYLWVMYYADLYNPFGVVCGRR
jgi:hypothetical protein